MRASTKKVITDIWYRKLRTILTILGIAIGITGLTGISIASSHFQSSLEYSSSQRLAPDMHIYTPPTNPDLATFIQQQPNIKTVQAQGGIVTRWQIGSDKKLIQVVGVLDFQQQKLDKFQLIEGKLPGAGEIALESGARTFSPVKVGDHISIQTGSQYQQLTISGFVQTQGRATAAIDNEAYGYMHETNFEQFFHRAGVTDFEIQLHNYDQRYQTLAQLSRSLQQDRHIPLDGSNVGRDDSVQQIATGIFSLMNVLSVVALLLSLILIISTISSLITEQIPTIGTMKAIGGQRGQIIRHYLTIVFCYALVGTVLGILAGISGGYALATYLGGLVSLHIGPLTITPLQIILNVLIGLLAPLLAALFPVFQGTKITVKQALSGYGVTNTTRQRGIGARLSHAFTRLFPQTMQFGMRSIFRKRTRAILTMLTLTIAGTAFLAIQTASFSFTSFLNQMYNNYHYHVLVNLSDPIALSDYQHTLASVSGVNKIEPLFQDTISTNWGDATLTGLHSNTQFYQKTNLTGRWFRDDDQNVVLLSKDAAAKSGLKIGDSITFHYGPHQATWHIIGTVQDYSGVGTDTLGALIAPLSQVNALMGIGADQTQKVMISSTQAQPDQASLNALSKRIDDAMSNAGYLPDVLTVQDEVAQAQAKYQTVFILLDMVAIIVGFVGAVGLANALAMSVLERRREIGILRSMGAVGTKVAQVFWTEGSTIGLLAWLFALILGLPASYALVLLQGKLLAPIPFAFAPLNLIWMLVAILILTSLASIGPVVGAMRVKIAQTLRYE